VGKDFKVDDRVMADFRAFLTAEKLKYKEEDLATNREQISHEIQEEVLRQVFGEGEARKRSLAWDPQVKKALDLVPRTELLLRDPQRFMAEREAEKRLAGVTEPPAPSTTGAEKPRTQRP
jgi:carboxyl-terminal processing protease